MSGQTWGHRAGEWWDNNPHHDEINQLRLLKLVGFWVNPVKIPGSRTKSGRRASKRKRISIISKWFKNVRGFKICACSSNTTNYSWIQRGIPLCHSLPALECHGGCDTLGMFQILPGPWKALGTRTGNWYLVCQTQKCQHAKLGQERQFRDVGAEGSVSPGTISWAKHLQMRVQEQRF